jgi:hypothetical protein
MILKAWPHPARPRMHRNPLRLIHNEDQGIAVKEAGLNIKILHAVTL